MPRATKPTVPDSRAQERDQLATRVMEYMWGGYAPDGSRRTEERFWNRANRVVRQTYADGIDTEAWYGAAVDRF